MFYGKTYREEIERGGTIDKPVLILAQEAGGIPQSIAQRLREKNFSVDLQIYDEKILNRQMPFCARIFKRIFDPGCQWEIKREFNAVLQNKLKYGSFSFILIMRGNYLTQESKELLVSFSNPKIVWLYDPLDSCKLQLEVATVSDFVFCVDKKDADLFPERSIWLPLGYDNKVYHPRNDLKKEIDVFISGSIKPKFYQKRKKILQYLDKSLISKKYRFCFVGTTGLRAQDRLIILKNIEWIGKRVTPLKLAELQASSKICINIHRDDSASVINPSFFSIPGSGSLMIAENNENFRSFLEPDKDFVKFDDMKDLPDLIEELLNNDKKRIETAESGYKKVLQEHTLDKRVDKILEIVRSLK